MEQTNTKIYELALGLSCANLEEELAQHLDDIDTVDLLGCTALIWAAARGNDRVVTSLPGAGANPKALDVQSTSTIPYAAERD